MFRCCAVYKVFHIVNCAHRSLVCVCVSCVDNNNNNDDDDDDDNIIAFVIIYTYQNDGYICSYCFLSSFAFDANATLHTL